MSPAWNFQRTGRAWRTRLAHECAKLDRASERAIAEEGMESDLSWWPAY